MAAATDQILERVEAGNAAALQAIGMQSQTLRLIAERLGMLVEKLTPEVGDGPTLQELLAELVARVGDNGAILRRIDRCTGSMETNLPADIVRAINATTGANGNGLGGHDPRGPAPA